MLQNQNQNNFHLHLNHSLLAVIAITNLLLIATIWYAPTINASYASTPTVEPAPAVIAPTPVVAPPIVNAYTPQPYPMQNQPAYYYPAQTPTYYPAATPYSQPAYDQYQAGYSYQPPVKFLVGL